MWVLLRRDQGTIIEGERKRERKIATEKNREMKKAEKSVSIVICNLILLLWICPLTALLVIGLRFCRMCCFDCLQWHAITTVSVNRFHANTPVAIYDRTWAFNSIVFFSFLCALSLSHSVSPYIWLGIFVPA